MHTAKLLFADGTKFLGKAFGYNKNVAGDVVFNTSMTGYSECLTDPSYVGQILVMTYPLQGNYGVANKLFESSKIQAQGMIVANQCLAPNHYASQFTLHDWLTQHKIPGIYGIDTRSLTQYLREAGTLTAKLIIDETNENFHAIAANKLLQHVTTYPILRYGRGLFKLLLIDLGCKESIIRELVARNTTVTRMAWHSHWETQLENYDGIVLSNGPGDPRAADTIIQKLKNIFKQQRIPIFGICLGHQIIALAAGGETKKLQYGHRSANQPVIDVKTNRCYMTSQNHGYVVLDHSLNNNWDVWFKNVNDGSNEGLHHRFKPICSVQFHPEAAPGPHDTSYIFDYFLKLVAQHKMQRVIATSPIPALSTNYL